MNLLWSLTLSSAVHSGLIGLIWLQMAGDPAPARTLLELIAVEVGPASVVAAPAWPPSRPQPLAAPSRPARPAPPPPQDPEPSSSAIRPADHPPFALAAASPAEPVAGTLPSPAPEAARASATAPTLGVGDVPGPVALRATESGTSGALVPPRPATEVPIGYPEKARRAGLEGTTVLQIKVLADGSVGDVRLERSTGHPDLDTAAIEAVRRWRFEPARRRGEPVDVWILLPIRFTLG